MKTAFLAAALALCPAIAVSQDYTKRQPAPAAAGYSANPYSQAPGPGPTRRPLAQTAPYGSAGSLPHAATYGSPAGSSPQANPLYPTSRTYYEYAPSAPRQDSYGRMRNVGGEDVDVRGNEMGADWYRNMPAPNYDYRGRRY